MTDLPLQNLTVIELAEGVAGPFCGRMLAGFGANVIKVELPGGDWTRSAEPRLPDVSDSTLFMHLNLGKQSVVLDWRTDEGHDQLKTLLQGADVLIEDWTAETRDSMELTAQLEDINPRLIDLSMTPFGTTGPYSGWQSTPLVSLALGGFLYLSGDKDREPLMIPGYQSEYLAGLHGYGGLMIALWERDLTGRGGRVEVSEIESLAALHQFTTVMYTYGGYVRSRHGARWENKGPYGRYPIALLPCKDGYVSYAVSTEGQWELLFPMVGKPELLTDPRFIEVEDRRNHADDIDAILIDWMKDKTRQEVFEFAAGTWSEPASPLLELAEVLADPQLEHRGLFQEIDHPDAGALTFPTVPFHMSATQPKFTRAPRLGEHTAEVLGRLSKIDTLVGGDPTLECHPEEAQRQTKDLSPPDDGEFGPTFGRRANVSVRDSSTPLYSAQNDNVVEILQDLRVLDLTRVWAGPLATRIMGDFGAEIIKISDPRTPIDRAGGTNNKLNRNKSNLALRLDQRAGRDLFLELVATSDLVVENYRPRVMRNFNLTYEDLRMVKPDIVMCSMPGYGTTGPYADYPAFGPSVEATTGLSSMMGYEGGPPRTSALAFPDLVAALNAVVSMMTALRHRRQTGQGQFIDQALTEGPICQIGEFIAEFSRTGVQPPRKGNTNPEHAPYGVYPARGDDEWISICVTSDEQWETLCSLMNSPELASDSRFGAQVSRRQNVVEVDNIVADWTRDQDAGELTVTLQSHGIAAGRASKNYQLLEDPHLNDRGFFVDIEEPDVGVKKYPGQAIRMGSLQISRWTPSARLGEDTSRIVAELLGMTGDEVAKLETDEIIRIFRDA